MRFKSAHGFTLVELLVVMAILGILTVIAATSFRSAQIKSRDAQRKSDLKQVANALESFYADYNKYPDDSSGRIMACKYFAVGASACEWGANDQAFSDNQGTIYMQNVPTDPSQFSYHYRSLNSQQSYQLYAHLENTEDPDCIGQNCASPTTIQGSTVDCGDGVVCNFSIHSSDVTDVQSDL